MPTGYDHPGWRPARTLNIRNLARSQIPWLTDNRPERKMLAALSPLQRTLTDSLYRNSILLMTSTTVTASFGFLFWIISARLFSPDQIGLATTLISVTALVSNSAQLGFNNGLIKYLPTSHHPNELISTSMVAVCVPAILLSVGYLAALPVVAPNLAPILGQPASAAVFVALGVAAAVNQLVDDAFVAFRSSAYVLAKGALQSVLRPLLSIPLAVVGALGLYGAYWAPALVSCIGGIALLAVAFHFRFSLAANAAVGRSVAVFNLATYAAVFLWNLPSLALPSLITHYLRPADTANFYVALMITNLVYVIPTATSQSLFAEGSYLQAQLKARMTKAVLLTALLVPLAIAVILLLGEHILAYFGSDYASSSLQALRLMMVSAVFASFNLVCSAVLNVRRRVSLNVLAAKICCSATLVLSVQFMPAGLTGIGVAWILGQASASLFYLVVLRGRLA